LCVYVCACVTEKESERVRQERGWGCRKTKKNTKKQKEKEMYFFLIERESERVRQEGGWGCRKTKKKYKTKKESGRRKERGENRRGGKQEKKQSPEIGGDADKGNDLLVTQLQQLTPLQCLG